MITWRGYVTLKQSRGGYRYDLVQVRTKFEIYDDADPTAVLLSRSVHDLWPLSVLAGLPPAQIANLLFNVGLRREIIGVPGVPPGTYTEPDPIPLKERAADLLLDYTDTYHILDLPLPLEFGP